MKTSKYTLVLSITIITILSIILLELVALNMQNSIEKPTQISLLNNNTNLIILGNSASAQFAHFSKINAKLTQLNSSGIQIPATSLIHWHLLAKNFITPNIDKKTPIIIMYKSDDLLKSGYFNSYENQRKLLLWSKKEDVELVESYTNVGFSIFQKISNLYNIKTPIHYTVRDFIPKILSSSRYVVNTHTEMNIFFSQENLRDRSSHNLITPIKRENNKFECFSQPEECINQSLLPTFIQALKGYNIIFIELDGNVTEQNQPLFQKMQNYTREYIISNNITHHSFLDKLVQDVYVANSYHIRHSHRNQTENFFIDFLIKENIVEERQGDTT